MVELPEPSTDYYNQFLGRTPAIRILSDRGIRQAVEQGFLDIDPPIDFSEPGKRLQPCTIDLKFEEVGSSFKPGTRKGEFLDEGRILGSGKCSWVEFNERILFNNPRRCFRGTESGMGFFDCFLDGRSSLLRLGAVILDSGASFFSGVEALVFNSSQNNIVLEQGERICQAFIRVHPFADSYGVPYRGQVPRTEEGDKIRTLEMGIQIFTNRDLEELSRQGLMKIERKNGERYVPYKGVALMHASKAFRTKKINGGIEFSKRGQYKKEDLLEEVNIRTKYEIKEDEHLIVEVEETFDLSPYVGVSVLNNFVKQGVPGVPKLSGFSPRKKTGNTPEDVRRSILNCALHSVRNSWIDPGYKGMMTGFPKILGKTIEKGDVVGYAQAFYFPKGVERPYGSADLGSHYQGQEAFKVTSTR